MKRKVLTALLSLVVAFGLWGYVITVERPEQTKTYYGIPVALEGESILTERGLMLVSGQNAVVNMLLKGNRSDLMNVNSANITLVADLTKIYDAGIVELPYTYSFPGNVAANAISVMSREPDVVQIEVANRITKEIPVQIVYTGKTPDPRKYIVDKENAVLDYSSVTAVGPENVIDQIHHAEIEVDLTDRTQSFSENYRYTLCDEEGNGVDSALVTTNLAEVRLELTIQQVKDIALSVTVVDGGGATQATSSIIIDPVTIRVSGNENVLSKLTTVNLGTVNLGELTKDTVLKLPINLDEGVTNLTGVTEATIAVSFPDLAMKEFTVKNIRATNVPEGLKEDLVTKALKVTVRGPKDQIRKMTQNDISVTVDLSEALEGTSTVKAKISINEKFVGVGEVGTYSVTATVQNPTDQEKEDKS